MRKKSVIFFDYIISLILLILLFIPAIIIGILIKLSSKGPVIYRQKRTGYKQKDFYIYKFRTMKQNSDNNSAITIGNDSRITKIGKILRKTKLDEIPQLLNILKGEMSFVGFRPDTPEYTEYYLKYNNKYFDIMPGITGKASIYLSNEEKLMEKINNPKEFYIKEIIPKKVELNKYHIKNNGIICNIKILLETLGKVLK